jgi:hypothetical protein
MGDDITIGVTEIVNNIEVTAQPNDQVIDIEVIDNSDDVTLNVTPNVIEVNINKGSSYARWGFIFGNLTDQADLTSALFNKADLVDGKVPSYQLPSFVDDVIEVANYAALPTVGEIGKIYITLDDNKIYRWSGSIYIEIASNPAIWGAITGSLTNQTDLVNALNLKANISGQVFTGAISATNLSGTNTGDQDLSGLVPNTRTLTINGVTQDLSANRSFTIASGVTSVFGRTGDVVATNGDYTTTQVTEGTNLYYTEARVNANANVAANTAARHSAVTIGTANGLSLSGQALSLALASGSTTGALSSTDWTTFNNKLSSLDGAVLTTTDQSITGTKTFNNTSAFDAIIVNSSGGRGIRINNSASGFGLLINNATLASAVPLAIQKNGSTVLSIDDSGLLTANSIVKSGGTAAQILAANGSVITAGTNITISGGTISASGSSTGSLEFNATDLTVWNNGKGNFSSNTSFGDGALKNNSSGTSITAYGNNSLRDNSSGNSNTALGVGSLISNSTGSNNVAIGQSAGQTYQNISSSIFIGNSTAGSGENQTNQIVIGHNAVGNGSNTVTLGNSSIVTTILRGNVGIGTPSPSGILHTLKSGTPITGVGDEVFIGQRSATGQNAAFTLVSNGETMIRLTNSSNIELGRILYDTNSNFMIFGVNSAERMRINSSGEVRINTLGTGLVYSNGGTLTSTNPSDSRLKDDIKDLQYGLNEILKLRPVSYNWKNDTINQGKQFGFIAQEVQEVMPELISEFIIIEDEEEVVRLGLDKEGIYATLVNAIKELKAEIELLKQK